MAIIFSIISKTGKVIIETRVKNMWTDDSYHISSVEGTPYVFDMKYPFTFSADKEWKMLSDDEKADVRVNGWTHFGRLQHAIAKALVHLNFDSNDAIFYENSLKTSKKKLDDIYDLLLNSDEDHESILAQPLDDYRVARKILHTYKYLHNFENYFPSDWVAPAE